MVGESLPGRQFLSIPALLERGPHQQRIPRASKSVTPRILGIAVSHIKIRVFYRNSGNFRGNRVIREAKWSGRYSDLARVARTNSKLVNSGPSAPTDQPVPHYKWCFTYSEIYRKFTRILPVSGKWYRNYQKKLIILKTESVVPEVGCPNCFYFPSENIINLLPANFQLIRATYKSCAPLLVSPDEIIVFQHFQKAKLI